MENYNTYFPDKTKSAVSITLKENDTIVENQNEVANNFNNFCPVSSLAVLSKIFEKIMSKQLSTFFKNILSKFQCGFRKVYSTQHCLLIILEKWELTVDNNEAFGALSTDRICIQLRSCILMVYYQNL